MALTIEQRTRVHQLRDDLAQLLAPHQARVTTPDSEPLFVRHADGSVYDRKGNELRGPLPASLVKEK